MRKLFVTSAVAFVIGTAFWLAPALAGTYEDKVFRPGEPRWGSSPRNWEDRNVQYRGPQGGYHGRRGHGTQQGSSRGSQFRTFEYHRRTITTGCLYKEDWVIRNGVKITLGYRPC